MKKTICIISLTEAGHLLAQRLRDSLQKATNEVQIYHKPQPFSKTVQALFVEGHSMIFITAMGIVVRSLADVLVSKQDDPPVIVMDELGDFVVPLLSGHEGGANELAKDVANRLGAQVVITTAKPYLSPVYTVGMGCEKGCSAAHLKQLLSQCLEQAGLTIEQIQSINSIDIKAQEQGLIDLSASIDKPYVTYSATELSVVEHLLNSKSDYVYSVVGVYGVAESAALLAAQSVTADVAELILNKQKTDKATCAIARSYPYKKE